MNQTPPMSPPVPPSPATRPETPATGGSAASARTGGPDRVAPAAPPSPARPVSVVGPVFLDIIMTGLSHAPRPGQEQWVDGCAIMAGGCANQAIALARLGLPVSLHCEIGTDEAGGLVRSRLEAEGLDLGHCVSVPTQNVTVSLAFDGDRAMTTAGSDRAPGLKAADPHPAVLVADMHAIADNREAVAAWRRGPSPTMVVADAGWDATGRWDPAELADLELVDVFVPNDAEALRYTRTASEREAVRALAQRVPLAVVTCGGRGVVACDGAQELALPAVAITPVDTTGAGDSFSAGLTWALSQGLPLRAALSAACLTAAFTLSRPGGSANAPTATRLAEYARRLSPPKGYDLSFLDLLDRTGAPHRPPEPDSNRTATKNQGEPRCPTIAPPPHHRDDPPSRAAAP